jgi:hypothetical protein
VGEGLFRHVRAGLDEARRPRSNLACVLGIRRKCEVSAELLNGSHVLAEPLEDHAEVERGIGVGRVELDGATQMRSGILEKT